MKRNVGTFDSIARFTLALTAIFLHYNKIVTGTAGSVLIVIAIVLFITGLTSTCPLYAILGINTQHKRHPVS